MSLNISTSNLPYSSTAGGGATGSLKIQFTSEGQVLVIIQTKQIYSLDQRRSVRNFGTK